MLKIHLWFVSDAYWVHLCVVFWTACICLLMQGGGSSGFHSARGGRKSPLGGEGGFLDVSGSRSNSQMQNRLKSAPPTPRSEDVSLLLGFVLWLRCAQKEYNVGIGFLSAFLALLGEVSLDDWANCTVTLGIWTFWCHPQPLRTTNLSCTIERCCSNVLDFPARGDI